MKHKKKEKKKPRKTKTGRSSISPERVSLIIYKVRDIIEPICESEGFELVHIEYGPETGGKILRLYIDKPNGVTLDDCAIISRQASDILDVLLEDIGSYNLEVSSPGVNRPLGKMKDFDRFKGHTAKLKLSEAINGQKNFKGSLAGISADNVRLLINDETIDIPYAVIARAHLVSNGEK